MTPVLVVGLLVAGALLDAIVLQRLRRALFPRPSSLCPPDPEVLARLARAEERLAYIHGVSASGFEFDEIAEEELFDSTISAS